MHKTSPARTPIYRDAPLSTHPSPSMAGTALHDHLSGSQQQQQQPLQDLATASWDTLRKEARLVESDIGNKLTTLSSYTLQQRPSTPLSSSRAPTPGVGGSSTTATAAAGGSGLLAPSSSSGGAQFRHLNGQVSDLPSNSEDVENDIDNQLKRLDQLVDAMSKYLEAPSTTGAPHPTSMFHILQRHRDSLYNYNKEFRTIRNNVRAARDHADLLTSVRDDISSFKAGQGSAADYYLGERARIDSSHLLADTALEQAFATRDDLAQQRTTLQNVNRRITDVAAQLPGVGNLIGKIQSRKRRDNVILSAVIGSCVVGVLYFGGVI
ncbi:hypothetical protein BGW42_008307 [Actinomortierella wolfii]|nr:hypothetical protein BGW42_008307 [Actinomortierella wolfii]KAG0245066.1 hypothetical protein BGW41_004323 [Actinomortierella wolfii]